jgi:2-amino-4-hydroxy-6-hydroxymethyldihydropteridine diphosphokinase
VRLLGVSFDLRGRSRVYETLPVGPPQPNYLNAAVRLFAEQRPEEVMRTLLAIEETRGRVRTAASRWGARTLDLDFLWGDGLVITTDALTVPHPHLIERPFALRPLLDVAPEARDPRTGQRFEVPIPSDGDGVTVTALEL